MVPYTFGASLVPKQALLLLLIHKKKATNDKKMRNTVKAGEPGIS